MGLAGDDGPMAQNETPGTDASGWEAIHARVLSSVHGLGSAEPLHWGSHTLPGRDGLYGLNAYAGGDAWLFVSLGLSELFEKESEDPSISGWGFEMTMRVPRTPGEPPPEWPVATLAQLGTYVFNTASPFAAGHRISTGPLPLTAGPDVLTALAFAVDPELGEMSTPHGHVTFLAAVGVTDGELERMQSSTTAEVLADLRASSPLLVTGAARR